MSDELDFLLKGAPAPAPATVAEAEAAARAEAVAREAAREAERVRASTRRDATVNRGTDRYYRSGQASALGPSRGDAVSAGGGARVAPRLPAAELDERSTDRYYRDRTPRALTQQQLAGVNGVTPLTSAAQLRDAAEGVARRLLDGEPIVRVRVAAALSLRLAAFLDSYVGRGLLSEDRRRDVVIEVSAPEALPETPPAAVAPDEDFLTIGHFHPPIDAATEVTEAAVPKAQEGPSLNLDLGDPAMLRTTFGQLAINDALPEPLRDYGRQLTGKELKDLLFRVARDHPEDYRGVSKRLADIGRHSATETGGNSFGLVHMRKSKAGAAVADEVAKRMRRVLDDDSLTDEQRNTLLVKAAGGLQERQMKEVYAESLAENNPLALQVASGARGNPANLTALRGSDLLYSDHHDETIPLPVLRSYSQGLTPAEYWAGTYGARKGIIDVKMATAKAGFFGKQLNQLTHRLLVTDLDGDGEPDTRRGLPVDTDDSDNEGALLARDAGPYKRNTLLTPKVLADLKRKKVNRILVRSPLVGGSPEGGTYARDIGVREKGGLPGRGEQVGLQAAQALAEPLSQSMLGSKHTGGVAGQGKTVGGFSDINQLVQGSENYRGLAGHASLDGTVEGIEAAPAGGHNVTVGGQRHHVGAGLELKVKRGDTVEAGDILSEGLPDARAVVEHKGLGEGRRYFTQALRDAYSSAGVKAHRRNIELVARGLINHVRLVEETDHHAPGDVVPYSSLEHTYQPRDGHTLAKPGKALLGRYLEQPVLHYSIGTKLRPSVVRELESFGIDEVATHDEPPPFEPEFVRGMTSLQHDPDVMTRMYGSGLKKSLLSAAHRGGSFDETGTSFVPALARAVDFGRIGVVRPPGPPVPVGDPDDDAAPLPGPKPKAPAAKPPQASRWSGLLKWGAAAPLGLGTPSTLPKQRPPRPVEAETVPGAGGDVQHYDPPGPLRPPPPGTRKPGTVGGVPKPVVPAAPKPPPQPYFTPMRRWGQHAASHGPGGQPQLPPQLPPRPTPQEEPERESALGRFLDPRRWNGTLPAPQQPAPEQAPEQSSWWGRLRDPRTWIETPPAPEQAPEHTLPPQQPGPQPQSRWGRLLRPGAAGGASPPPQQAPQHGPNTPTIDRMLPWRQQPVSQEAPAPAPPEKGHWLYNTAFGNLLRGVGNDAKRVGSAALSIAGLANPAWGTAIETYGTLNAINTNDPNRLALATYRAAAQQGDQEAIAKLKELGHPPEEGSLAGSGLNEGSYRHGSIVAKSPVGDVRLGLDQTDTPPTSGYDTEAKRQQLKWWKARNDRTLAGLFRAKNWKGWGDNPIVNEITDLYNPVGTAMATHKNVEDIVSTQQSTDKLIKDYAEKDQANTRGAQYLNKSRGQVLAHLRAIRAKGGTLTPGQVQELANMERTEAMTPAQRETTNMDWWDKMRHNSWVRPVTGWDQLQEGDAVNPVTSNPVRWNNLGGLTSSSLW